MKLSLLFVAILGIATVAAVPTSKALNRSTRSLSDDWADFYALIDADAILAIALQYYAEDAEVQAAIEYIKSDEFNELHHAVEHIPEYIAFLNYLEAGGLNVYYYINLIHDLLGLEHLHEHSARLASTRITGGIAGLWADIKATLPLAELRALFDEKLQTSQDFADLIALFTSAEAQKIYDEIKAHAEYQYLRAALIEYGLDIDYFFDVVKNLIGYA